MYFPDRIQQSSCCLLKVKLIPNWWAWQLVPSKVGGSPVQSNRHNGEVPWQPCEREPALQAAINKRGETEGTSVEKLTWPDTYHEPLPRSGKSWALIWQKRGPKQWSTKLNWASKLQIWWPKQWSVQGSDPKWSAEQTTANMVTRAHMQAHGKASPCRHSIDYRDCWKHWLEINFT